MSTRVRKRRVERHNAASLRAISGRPDAEYNTRSLQVARQKKRFYSPHLFANSSEHSLQRCRGVADALGFRLYLSNSNIYRKNCPEDRLAALLYDLLEQLRVEALVPKTLRGVRTNLDAAFSEWCDESHATGLTENKTGLLIYTVAHMVRSRLTGKPQSEEVESLIEATRAGISSLIGFELGDLKANVANQMVYSLAAKCLAEKIANLQENSDVKLDERDSLAERLRLVLPPVADQQELDDKDGLAVGLPGDSNAQLLDELSNYSAYSREFDVEVAASSLYSGIIQTRTRTELDQLVAAQSVSVSRLALRLSWLLSDPAERSWSFGVDTGMLDARRLTQLVCNPAQRDIFYRPKTSNHSDAMVSFLIDNSGSMKKHRFATVAMYVDILSRALDLAGITNEVLGFTTGGWSGGRVLKDWRNAGSPEAPGRLNETQHIRYKVAEKSWRKQRRSLSLMLNTQHFREGVDGEALVWAWSRLQARPERRKILLLISDGLPNDSATTQSNGEHYLHNHLRSATSWIENDSRVQLGAIGIGDDLSSYFSKSCQLDMQGALSNSSFNILEDLFLSFTKSNR